MHKSSDHNSGHERIEALFGQMSCRLQCMLGFWGNFAVCGLLLQRASFYPLPATTKIMCNKDNKRHN